MPVPFPTPETVKLTPPDAEEARIIAGGVVGAVANPDLTGLQTMLIDALMESMTGFVVPVGVIPRIEPEDFARLLADRDENFRNRMLHFCMLCSLVLNPLPEEVVARVERYGEEMGVRHDMLRVARNFARGSLGLALFDFQRSGYSASWSAEHSQSLHTSRALEDAWAACVDDPALAAQWDSLAELPEGTLGRRVAQFYEARGFVCPGRPGSAPPLLAQHDWVHVLCDYGSTVESELEVFGFIARCNDDPQGFSLLAMVISLFETGYLASGAGLFEYDRGHLSHEGMAVRLADAMRRGALTAARAGGPDLLRIDWYELADLPLEEARAHFGVVPKSDRAVELGSVTPWERGGISPYQYEQGQAAATAAGRPYRSYGAEPA